MSPGVLMTGVCLLLIFLVEGAEEYGGSAVVVRRGRERRHGQRGLGGGRSHKSRMLHGVGLFVRR
jgi:hypothetical protein